MSVRTGIFVLAAALAPACDDFDPPARGAIASCCGGTGLCIPAQAAPPELAARLPADTCSESLVCARGTFLLAALVGADGGAPLRPASCRAPGELEGRCLWGCLSEVAANAALLQQQNCDRDERCVPCYDPLSGKDTGACRVAGDQPAMPR